LSSVSVRKSGVADAPMISAAAVRMSVRSRSSSRVCRPRARSASARAAKVQLLIDRNAAAGALIERSRAQGVALGAGDERLRLEYVSETSDVVVGDLVVTSGIDGIYPKGFTIGHVDTVEKSGPAYKRITVKPAVNFSSLETVLVVLTPSAIKQVEQENKEIKEIKE